MMRYLVILLLFCISSCRSDQPSKTSKQTTIDLLANTSLSHMQQRGGNAKYSLESGILTGYTKYGTPNSFLCTKDMYADFILDFKVSIDPRLNSGVQIRSDSVSVKGRETVAGMQVEIDPSSRAWSGGIYEENRRGWIHSLAHNPTARAAFKNGSWNSFHIEAIGNSIRVWVNDVNTSNLLDTASLAGIIGFQVHSIGDKKMEGTTVQWKDIRLITSDFDKHRKEIKETDPEINLLPNALSQTESDKGWILAVPNIDGKERTKNRVPLASVEGDFELKLEYKINKKEASTIEYAQNQRGEPILEYSILDDINRTKIKKNSHKSGGLFNKMQAQNLSHPDRDKPVRFYNQWSQVHIIVKDGRVQHWLNNSLVLEYKIADVGSIRKKKQVYFKNKGGGAFIRSVKLRNL